MSFSPDRGRVQKGNSDGLATTCEVLIYFPGTFGEEFFEDEPPLLPPPIKDCGNRSGCTSMCKSKGGRTELAMKLLVHTLLHTYQMFRKADQGVRVRGENLGSWQ